MRWALLLLALVALGLAVVGLQGWMAEAALGFQRQAQDALAGALRALRNGEPGAVAGFLTICFLHGFLHALGPGHGKGVIAAYAVAAPVAPSRLVVIAGLSSLAQAVTAILVVYAGVWLLDGAREGVEGLAAAIEPLSFGFVALLGLMLCFRAWRHFPREGAGHGHHHHHDHDHGPDCGCGHSHAPDPEALAKAGSAREVAALVAGVALRPCTSALFLLILTWRLGLDALGILGALVMGVGTMAVTLSSGLLAGMARRGLIGIARGGGALARGLVAAEFLLGAAILIFAGSAALRLL